MSDNPKTDETIDAQVTGFLLTKGHRPLLSVVKSAQQKDDHRRTLSFYLYQLHYSVWKQYMDVFKVITKEQPKGYTSKEARLNSVKINEIYSKHVWKPCKKVIMK